MLVTPIVIDAQNLNCSVACKFCSGAEPLLVAVVTVCSPNLGLIKTGDSHGHEKLFHSLWSR